MQCKDIPDGPILQFLLDAGQWCGWSHYHKYNVAKAMPQGIPAKLVLAKMAQLIKRGLSTGCACGCRGDFQISQKGRAALAPSLPTKALGDLGQKEGL